LKERLRERSYYAQLAGIYTDISTTNTGIEIYYSSYNQ